MKLKHTARTSRYKGLLRLDGNRNKPGVLRSAKAGEGRRGGEERVFENGHRLDLLNIIEEKYDCSQSIKKSNNIFARNLFKSNTLGGYNISLNRPLLKF